VKEPLISVIAKALACQSAFTRLRDCFVSIVSSQMTDIEFTVPLLLFTSNCPTANCFTDHCQFANLQKPTPTRLSTNSQRSVQNKGPVIGLIVMVKGIIAIQKPHRHHHHFRFTGQTVQNFGMPNFYWSCSQSCPDSPPYHNPGSCLQFFTYTKSGLFQKPCFLIVSILAPLVTSRI